MASILEAPKIAIGKAIPPWEKFDLPPETQQRIYKDWGSYYSLRRRANYAVHYFNRALDLYDKDHTTQYKRSQSKRRVADIEGALVDSMKAAKIAWENGREYAFINLEVCDNLYELNQFENSKMKIHTNIRHFKGVKSRNFVQRLAMVDEVINDVTGDAMTAFFSKHGKTVDEVYEIKKAKDQIDERPRWKVMKEQGKCDVLSIPEIEEVLLSPLEMARRGRAYKAYLETYINRSSIDVLFLKQLRKNPTLLLPQCKRSLSFLSSESNRQYDIVVKFLKMLQARGPLYYVNYMKYGNMKLWEKYKEAYYFRIQYQTHRNMNAALKTISQLRKNKDIKSLTAYVESLMGDYVVLKINRIMCWKFEFINQVYNTLALALAEQYIVPKNLNPSDKFSIHKLLHLPVEKFKDLVTFVFGDRSTHQEPDVQDASTIAAKKLIARLERRMVFAKYSIERCYLYHRISQALFDQDYNDECDFTARKAIRESKNCNSNLWRLLSYIQIIKSNAALHKVERTKEALDEALPIARKLRSPKLIAFIEACIACNEQEFNTKKTSQLSAWESKYSMQRKSFNWKL